MILVIDLTMRNSLVSVGLLLAALLAGCAAGVPPTGTSTIQTSSERSGAEAILRPPVETHTAEGTGLQIYEYDRRLAAAAEGKIPNVRARSDSDGVITAVTYHEITDQISVVVDLHDDSDLNRLILEHITRSLRQAKHTIAARPLFELSFSSHFHLPVLFKKEPTLGEVSFGSDLTPNRLEINVWSSTYDSLLTGRRGRSRIIGQYEFEIHASLRERSSGHVVWEGRVIAYVESAKAADAVPSMVAALLANLGRNPRGDRFPLK
jgi:hypothetical protein